MSIGYYDRVNPELFRLMPPDARVVLEIGCGAGALAAAYRARNPSVAYLGVERALEPAQRAVMPGRLDRIFVGDVETFDPGRLDLDDTTPTVDCLVFGDVLEHLVDPWSVVERLVRLVRPEGQVLASIPNIQHYSVVANLLRGKWEYQDEGLLDRTHLRFFTLDGALELFTRAGLHVHDVVTRSTPGAEPARFRDLLEPVLSSLKIDAVDFATRSAVVQFVIRAGRMTHAPARTLIRALLGSEIGSEVRIQEPLAFLATIPGVRIRHSPRLTLESLNDVQPGEERILLQQRIVLPLPEHLNLQRSLLERGYLIIAEFDDDPAHFPMLNATNGFAFRSCHAVQTTTETMAQTLRAWNPEVAVFPNQVASLGAAQALKRASAENPSATQVTLFFGALNREADWAPLVPAINRVLAELGGQVHVLVVHDRTFHDALITPHKSFEPLCSYERYHMLLETADVALLPLEPSQFNQHKSDLKFIESAAHGITVLASPTVYDRSIRHGETGFLYQSLAEFESTLKRLLREPALRLKVGRNAYQMVADHRLLSHHYRTRLTWYQQLLHSRAQLQQSLLERTPELRET